MLFPTIGGHRTSECHQAVAKGTCECPDKGMAGAAVRRKKEGWKIYLTRQPIPVPNRPGRVAETPPDHRVEQTAYPPFVDQTSFAGSPG